MERIAFLRDVYKAVPPELTTKLYVYNWSRNEIEKKAGATRSFRISDLELMDKAVESMNYYPYGVSFSPGMLERPIEKHAADNDIVALSNLWIDIDVKSGVHFEETLYERVEDVIETMGNTLKPLGLFPNIIVSSGYGVHGYWILQDLLWTRTTEERNHARFLLSSLQSIIRHLSRPKVIDKTDNLGRTLRLPGTVNWKGGFENPVRSGVIYHNSLFYSVNDITQRIEETHKKIYPVSKEPSAMSERQIEAVERMRTAPVYDKPSLKLNISGDSELLFKHCSFFKMILTRMNSLNYHTLLAAIPILLTDTEQGERIAIELCKEKFGEKFEEYKSRKHIEELKRKLKPTTCKKLREILPNLDCTKCPVNSKARSSPCALIQSQSVRDEVESAPNSIGELISDAPDSIRNLIFPRGYKINEAGLLDLNTSRILMDTPVIISEKISFFDDSGTKYRIQYQSGGGRWITREILLNQLTNGKNVTETLANIGIATNSNVSRQAVDFFLNFLVLNKGIIKEKMRFERIGWEKDRYILPTTIRENEEFTQSETIKGFRIRGSGDKEKTLIYEGLQYGAVRAAIATVLASPMLRLVDYRNFIVDLYGRTATGKTATQTLANSMMGSPDLIIQMNATANAFEMESSHRNDIATISNERQLISSNPKAREQFFSGLVYRQESGQTKRRLNKNAETKPIREWKSILLVSGEEPMIRENALGGEITRVLEFEFLPFIGKMVEGKEEVNEKLISRIYSDTKNNYGNTFSQYIKRLEGVDREGLKSEWNDITEELMKETGQGIQMDHAKMLALLMLAYRKFLVWIFEFSEEEAKQATKDDFRELVEQIPNKEGNRDSDRARMYIIDWYAMNEMYFQRVDQAESRVVREIYGYYDKANNQPMIIPTVLKDALKEGGYSPAKIFAEWRRSGEITYDGHAYSEMYQCVDGVRRRLTKLTFLRQSDNTEAVDDEGGAPPEQMPF